MLKTTHLIFFAGLLTLLLIPSLALANAVSFPNGKAEGVVASIDGDH
jgi:hypothetical protein